MMKWLLVIGAACACFLMLALGCGKGSHPRTVESNLAAEPEQTHGPRDLAGILAEIDAYQPPEGVDRELFERMRAQLRKAIERNWNARSTLALNSYDYNKIQDLERTSGRDEPVKLKWSYRNLGDYDQNGAVGISDVTPIAIHYGEHFPDMWQEIDEIIDVGHIVFGWPTGQSLIGDEANGGWDFEVLAYVYGNTITGYAVFGADEWQDPYTEFSPPEIMSFDNLQGKDEDGNGVLDARGWLDEEITSRGKPWIKMVPVNEEGERFEALGVARVDLTPFVDWYNVRPISGTPGAVVEFRCDARIQPPGTTYQWDFGGGATPDTASGHTGTITLSELPIDYQASVTVNNGFATYVHNWVLHVTPEPIILSVSPTAVLAGEETQFTVEWTGSRDGVSFYWQFHDGWATPSESYDESPVVIPGAAGHDRFLSVTVTNHYGQVTSSYFIDVGRRPVITSVGPSNAVSGFQQTFQVQLDFTDSPPYDYEWNFGGTYKPTYRNNRSATWTFWEAGEQQCSVTATNEYGSDTEDFTVYVRKNKIWLVAEPSTFNSDDDWEVTVRVIAVDNGYPMTRLTSALVQYDEHSGLVQLADGNVNPGAIGGDSSIADGFWESFNDHGFDMFFVMTMPEAVDYMIPYELDEPYPPPIGSAAFICAVSPTFLGPEYAAPAGSGLSLADYIQHNSSPTDGDVFNFTLKLDDDFVPGPASPTEVRIRLVNDILRDEGNNPDRVTYYTDDNSVDYKWYVVQIEDTWVGVPERYYLTIPIDAN